MRTYDVIAKKRDGNELNESEINHVVNGYVNGSIPDYQMAAFLMAVYLKGMTVKECTYFTKCMLSSGDIMDLSHIAGVKVDKHSTGGVGDKTTLIIAPIVAACGVKVAKMSGRGLGHTGGTVDKLESIEGFKVGLEKEKFFDILKKVGCCIVSQTGNLVPADKKIYALRDVTATVESIPLIASSIMSKKLASGADCILLDVKVGSGAFMKTSEEAIKLSKLMVEIGESFGKKVTAVVTGMDEPLGSSIGNFLEILESYEVLKGNGPEDLREVSLYLASQMLYMAGMGNLTECQDKAKRSIESGSALKKFKEMICAQGGNISALEDEYCKIKFRVKYECLSSAAGYVTHIDASQVGKASMFLGAGRLVKEDSIDPYAGIVLSKKVGDQVNEGEVLGTLYSSDVIKCKEAENIFKESFKISNKQPYKSPFVRAKVTFGKVDTYVL